MDRILDPHSSRRRASHEGSGARTRSQARDADCRRRESVSLALDIYGLWLRELLPILVQVLAMTIVVGAMFYGMITEDSEREGGS